MFFNEISFVVIGWGFFKQVYGLNEVCFCFWFDNFC